MLQIDGKTSWGNNSLTSLYDVDVSNSREAQLLVFAGRSLFWVKRDVPEPSQGGVQYSTSNFWIYLIAFIHISALLLGFFHFSVTLAEQTASEKRPGISRDTSFRTFYAELGLLGREHTQSAAVARRQVLEAYPNKRRAQVQSGGEEEGVEPKDWDPADPTRKRIKKVTRRSSLDMRSSSSNRKPQQLISRI